MGDVSTIEWLTDSSGTTGSTWNPTRGCARVSKGCEHCFAESWAHRFSDTNQPYAGLTKTVNGHGVWTGKVQLIPERLDVPLRWPAGRRIFVDSMSDLFHPDIPERFIHAVFGVMALAPQHLYLILTKRPDRMRLVAERMNIAMCLDAALDLVPGPSVNRLIQQRSTAEPFPSWPLPYVWLGTSAEDQKTADLRLPQLLATPSAHRFLSAEPLLGQLMLSRYLLRPVALEWVIVGGESGGIHTVRPMHPAWARTVRDQCIIANVPFFFKQWGTWCPTVPDDADHNMVRAQVRITDGMVHSRTGWPNDDVRTHAAGFDTPMYRVGKKKAGRLLDGATHSALPEWRATTSKKVKQVVKRGRQDAMSF